MADSTSSHPIETWDVLVGRVAGHWGRDLLRVVSFSDNPHRFDADSLLCAQKDGKRQLIKVLLSHRQSKYHVLDCGLSPAQAQNLKGAELFIHASMRAGLSDGEFYADQMLGMRVRDEDDQDLGIIEEILETSAHDIYCTPQTMIPAVPEYIVKRDFENNVLYVKDLPNWED